MSLKEISTKLDIDKQSIYRFVMRNNISESYQDGRTKYYDEVAQSQIFSHFMKKDIGCSTKGASHLTNEAPQKIFINKEINRVNEIDAVVDVERDVISEAANDFQVSNYDELIEILKSTIETLTQQLKAKDEQIAALTEAIKLQVESINIDSKTNLTTKIIKGKQMLFDEDDNEIQSKNQSLLQRMKNKFIKLH